MSKKCRGGLQGFRPALWVLVALVLINFAPEPAVAQSHGAQIAKTCQGPKLIGQTTDCDITITNADGFGDSIAVKAATDVVFATAGNTSIPIGGGNLPITAVSGNTTCTVAGALPCNIGPNIGGGPGSVTFTSNEYVIQSDDPDPLPNQATVTVNDNCDDPDTLNCVSIDNNLQFTAGTDIGICEVSINVAKRCDLNDPFIDNQLVTNNDDNTLGCTSIDGLNVQFFSEVENTGDFALNSCQYTGTTLSEAALSVNENVNTGIQTDLCSNVDGVMQVSVTCDCVGFEGVQVTATDSAEIDCVNCDADIEKTVACGDGEFGEFCLSWLNSNDTDAENVAVNVEAADNSDPGASLVNCVLEDSNMIIDTAIGGPVSVPDDLGLIGDFDQLCSQALVDAEGNDGDTATLTCDCQVDADPDIVATNYVFEDDANFDCHAAGVMISKVCDPQGQNGVAPNQNKVTVTVTNVGDQDENTTDATLIDCVVTDTLARDDSNCENADENQPLTNTADPTDFDLGPAGQEMFMSVIGEGEAELTLSSCNTATVTCKIDDGTGNPVQENGEDKLIIKTDDDLCEVETGCFPHTIGFWSNRSAFVEAAGEIMVCGQTLDGFEEVSGLLCDRGQEILNAQCAAAALNEAASNSEAGGGSCMPDADGAVGSLLAVCCASNGEGGCAPAPNGLTMEQCITQVTEFNEDEPTLDCFALGVSADFCNPGRNGPESCPPPGKAKK